MRLSLYEIEKLLRDNDFKLVKSYPKYDVWEKNGIELMIPTIYDKIPDLLCRQISKRIKAVK